MNESDIKRKLSLLKRIRPDRTLLAEIREDADQRIILDGRRTKAPRYMFIGMAAAFICLFIIGLPALFPDQVQTAILTSRLALAANQYDKARIALADTKQQFARGPVSGQRVTELATSLIRTNAELSNLSLHGEAGQYTARQCRDIYTEYYAFLEARERMLTALNDPSLSALLSRIDAYEKQAAKRLHLYDPL